MSIKLYMDVHVRRAVTTGLRLRGIDVWTAQDDDLLREAARRQQIGERFAGVIYGHQLNVTIGQCIDDLEIMAQATEPEEWLNQVVYLPLK